LPKRDQQKGGGGGENRLIIRTISRILAESQRRVYERKKDAGREEKEQHAQFFDANEKKFHGFDCGGRRAKEGKKASVT